MKNIFFPALLLLFVTSSAIYSQNYFETYKQPALIEGSNLVLSTSPSFFAGKSQNGSSSDINLFLSGGITYTKWKFTPKLLYSVSGKFDGLFVSRSQNDYVPILDAKSLTVYNSSMASTTLQGGISYYLYKNLIYTGAQTNFSHRAETKNAPGYYFEFFPYIGFGNLVNTARVSRALNIQQILLDEKLISTRLAAKTLNMLVDLLDRDYAGELDSKYKDDAEIEFYAQAEKMLKDAGAIPENLDSRTVLKISQALTNSKFVYFPNYKGWQVQAEAFFLADNRHDYKITGSINSVTLSTIYGRPIGLKNNFTGSVFFTFPVKYNHLEDFYSHEFHSPVTLAEKYIKDLTTGYYDAAEYDDTLRYALSGRLNFYHIINRNAGAFLLAKGSIGKINDNEHKGSFEISANLVYNILNRMVGTASAEFYKNFRQTYGFIIKGGLSYYVF